MNEERWLHNNEHFAGSDLATYSYSINLENVLWMNERHVASVVTVALGTRASRNNQVLRPRAC